MIDTKRFKGRREAVGLSQSALAIKSGVSQSLIGKIEAGLSNSTTFLHKIARILETSPEYLTGETDNPEIGAFPRVNADLLAEQFNIVQVQKIDLELGLGGTYADSPVQIEMVSVDRDWLEIYTSAAPQNVFLAKCRGNSMQPTINNGDWIVGNFAKKAPRSIDDIWVITLQGLHGVKRLRPIGNGYKILSDNQNVPDEIAIDGEMSIIGRVEAIIKRV